jgi:thioredoxin reductase
VGGTVLHYPRHKIVMTRPVHLPLYGKMKFTDVSKEDLLRKWEHILDTTKLEIRTGVRVEGVKRGDDGVFDLKTSAGPLRAQRVPRKLGVPGEDLAKVVYRLIEPEQYTGRNCLVVGGGDAAVEAAIALGEAKAVAHLVHRGKIFDRIKPKNQEKLDKAIAAGTVKVLLEAQTKEVRAGEVAVQVGADLMTLPNDDVLVMIGGVLPTAFLEAAGVQVKTYKGEAFAPANV